MDFIIWAALGLGGASFAFISQQGDKIKKLEARIARLEERLDD